VSVDGKPTATDFDTLAFALQIKCEKNPDADKDEVDPNKAFRHANGISYSRIFVHFPVYSGDIQWIPQGSQEIWFQGNPIRPVQDNILIAKLRPGQVLLILRSI